jgi:hypothetical protein
MAPELSRRTDRAGIVLTLLPSRPMVKSRPPKWMDTLGVRSTWEPPLGLTVVPRFLGGGGRAFGALIASPLPLKGRLRLPKWITVPGGRLSLLLTIQSLDNLVAERAMPLPGAPIVGVPYLALTSKFIVHVPGSRGCAQRAQGLYWFGQNVPTSSHRRLEVPTPLMIKVIVGVTSGREREERLPSLFIRVEVELGSCMVES